jgi:hypothetical protein
MVNWLRNILILIIVMMTMTNVHSLAQTAPQLSVTLIGQSAGHYVAPAGQTTDVKVEILNVAPSDVYLREGDAYFDPTLNGTWELAHTEGMDNFQLSYLQSAIWTFGLRIPQRIQAANTTNGMPQVDLLIKIIYLTDGGSQRMEQATFALGVPGASVRGWNTMIWLPLAGLMVIVCVGAVYRIAKRRRGR